MHAPFAAAVLAAALLTAAPAQAAVAAAAPPAQPSDSVEVRAVLAAYNDVLAADPRLARARTLVSQGAPEAVPALDAYLRTAPTRGEAWYLLGVLHARLRNDADAARAFTRAVQHKPALRILLEEAKRRGVGPAIAASRELSRRNAAQP
jgi:cytochrome c-type biogenesis protein CcmH/NrfG